jgi:hypothetical protein
MTLSKNTAALTILVGEIADRFHLTPAQVREFLADNPVRVGRRGWKARYVEKHRVALRHLSIHGDLPGARREWYVPCGVDGEKKYPFEIVLCGGWPKWYELRSRLYRGGSTHKVGVQALSGMFDRVVYEWDGELDGEDAAVVRGHLGLTPEEAAEAVRAYRKEVQERHPQELHPIQWWV